MHTCVSLSYITKIISSACCSVDSMASLTHEDDSQKYSSCLAPQLSPACTLTVYSVCKSTFLCLSLSLMPPQIMYSRESLQNHPTVFPTRLPIAKQRPVWKADVSFSTFTYRSAGALTGYTNPCRCNCFTPIHSVQSSMFANTFSIRTWKLDFLNDVFFFISPLIWH